MHIHQIVKHYIERRELLAILVSLLLITSLHYSTAPGLSQLHAVYRYCYFLPIVFAALRYGFWGGLLTGLGVSLVFIPHILFRWNAHTVDAFNDLLVVVIFFAVATVTGITSDRMRQMQWRYKQTAEQLAESLHRLEAQGEELRRAEQISALGALAGGLAHEIRNPVGIIRATAQLLDAESTPDAREGITIIQQEADRIERLICQLIDYAGNHSPTRVETEAAALLQQVSERIQPLTEPLDIAVQCTISPTSLTLCIDPEQFEQVLMNLCVNAIQALNGPGTLELHARLTSETESTVELWVKDSGPGITPEELTRVFHPFYSSKEMGTGLGLNVVQRVVTDHGGRVWIDSERGKGTKVVVEGPFAGPLTAGMEAGSGGHNFGH